MDVNKMKRKLGDALAVDLIVGYDLPKYNKMEQECYFLNHKPSYIDELFYIHGLVSSLLIQTFLARYDYGFDSPWPRKKLVLSDWQWKVFAEILEIFPNEFCELFYELDNSKEINQRQTLTLIQVALTHTFDRLREQIHV